MWKMVYGRKGRNLEDQIDVLLRLAEEDFEECRYLSARTRAREAMELIKKAKDSKYKARAYSISKALLDRIDKERRAEADNVSFSELEEEIRAGYPLKSYENRDVNAYWRNNYS